MDDSGSVVIASLVSIAIAIGAFVVSCVACLCVSTYLKILEDSDNHVRRCGDLFTEGRLHPLTTEKISSRTNWSHIANSFQIELDAIDTPNPLIPYTNTKAIHTILATKNGQPLFPIGAVLPEDKDKQEPHKEGTPLAPAKIDQKKVVAVNDPNYQTLAGLNNTDAFGQVKNEPAAAAPSKDAKPGQDDQYQMLTNLAEDEKRAEMKEKADKKKKKEDDDDDDETSFDKSPDKRAQQAKEAEPQQEKKKKVEMAPLVDDRDQQYQTLDALEKPDVFEPKKKAEPHMKEGKPADDKKKFEPPKENKDGDQYQTLDVYENADVFAPQKAAFKAPTQVQKADSRDPQYQTLAGLDDNLFKEEAAKKKSKTEVVKSRKSKKEKKKKDDLTNVGDDIFKQKSKRSARRSMKERSTQRSSRRAKAKE